MSFLVLDNTVLSHFARAGQLAMLKKLLAGHRCVVPPEVRKELLAGISEYPALAGVMTLRWLHTAPLSTADELVTFAKYKAEFGGGLAKNNGEAAVLAYATHNSGSVLIDERAATLAAERDGIDVHGTVWLITNGIRDGKLTRVEAEHLVDRLRASDMKLPTDGAGLFAWAYANGLLP
jgi:predicted nucleic acid-binding protein